MTALCLATAALLVFVNLHNLSEQSSRLIESALHEPFADHLQHGISRTRTAFAVLVLIIMIVLSLTAVAFLRLVSRPLTQIEDGIRALGGTELDEPIRVSGTRDLHAVGQSLEWLRARIRELETGKSAFVRHMSHELKSPLANIKTGVELLKEPSLHDAANRDEIIAIVERNATRLQRQIDDLLDYAGWVDAPPPAKPMPLRLDALISGVIHDRRNESAARRIRVESDLAPATLAGEERQIHSLVDNLIGNALKYSPEGGTVRVRLHCEASSVVIDVQDQGPGIPAELRERVFEPFYRGPQGGMSPGAGIGLAIALTAAKSHSGSIRILERETGAHVQVSLPLSANG